jgi:hypothetical protein
MNIDFEERLRADMGQVQVRPRPGLARDAHRRYQQGRRRNALAVAATGTVAAVAGATAGFALTAGSSGTAPIETTAYVVSHINNALASTKLIGYSAARLGAPHAPGLSFRTDTWQFGGRFRQVSDNRDGQEFGDVSYRPKGRSEVLTQVDYGSRTWSRATLRADEVPRPFPVDNLCTGQATGLIGPGSPAANWRRIIQTGLKCGAFKVTGRQWVDGVDAIKLTERKAVPGSAIWVDPASYLPVRLVSHLRVVVIGKGGSQQPVITTLTIDFRWLRPTKTNLAKLTAPIPAGFRAVKYPNP